MTPLSRRRLLHAALLAAPLVTACQKQGASPAALEDHGPAAAAEPAGTAAAVPDASHAATQEAAQPRPTPAPPAAVPRRRTIILDPGHGADEIGAASALPGLPNLLEKDSNLAFGFRLRELLESDGYRVLMTRESDSRGFGFVPPVNPSPGPGGMTVGRADLQARVDFANQSGGDLFLSLHSNDSGSLDENGVEVWYCADREDGAANAVWAQLVLDSVLDALRGYGYAATDRGIKEDRNFRVRNGRSFHLFVLGPANPEFGHPRATMMPAALVENLFMRYPRDIQVLRDPAGREAISQGMRRAVNRFFELQGG
jgi:N-acetylmuramoyl-L-alanine amidase